MMSCPRDLDLNELVLEQLADYDVDNTVLRQLREQLEEQKRKRAKKEADETTRLERMVRCAQDGSFRVTVRTLNVAAGSFRVKSWSTVSDLRAMIAQDMGIPSRSQGLALGTRPVARKESGALLAEIGVNPCNATFTVTRLQQPRVTLCTPERALQNLGLKWGRNAHLLGMLRWARHGHQGHPIRP